MGNMFYITLSNKRRKHVINNMISKKKKSTPKIVKNVM